MLGAVRHNGYIPWDDDIDILVPRDDFEKLRGLIGKNPGDVECVSFELPGEDKAFYPFIKAVNRKYICEDSHFTDDHPIYVWIDIFPLDRFRMPWKNVRSGQDIWWPCGVSCIPAFCRRRTGKNANPVI